MFKKFCNTDIIGKIYIIMISFVLLIAIVTVTVMYANVGKKEEQQNGEDVAVMLESPPIETITNVDITELEDNPIIEEIKVEQPKQEIIATPTISATPVVKTTNETKNTTSGKVVKNATDNKTQVVIQTQEPVIETINNNQEADIPTNVPIPQTKGEGAKYVVNNQMINTIKSYIENNPTDDMLTLGYNVQVDSSIKELTNPFTYTEKRLSALINLKFGTIRIYAEDYYYDGEYVTTYSYVI